MVLYCPVALMLTARCCSDRWVCFFFPFLGGFLPNAGPLFYAVGEGLAPPGGGCGGLYS